MTEEQAQDSVREEEVAAPQEEQNAQVEQEQKEVSQNSEEPEVGSKEYNWRQMNAQNRELHRRIEELEKQKAKPEVKEEEKDPWDGLEEEDIVCVGQVKNMVSKAIEKYAPKYAKRILDEREKELEPERLKSKYSDFEDVVSNYSIPILEKNEALLTAVKNSNNPYLAAYEIGKLYKGGKSPSNINKIKENDAKPKSSGSVASQGSRTPDGSFNKMSRDEVWKLSQKYAQGY